MVSSSGNSTGTSATTTSTAEKTLKNSSSEEDLLVAMEERKRKRMESNRESARRSRLRKQKHLDDLMTQVAQLRRENAQVLETMNLTTRHFLNVKAENSVLQAQLAELTNRLDSLNEMISLISSSSSSAAVGIGGAVDHQMVVGGLGGGNMLLAGNPWNLAYAMNQPIMAAADYHHDLFGYQAEKIWPFHGQNNLVGGAV